MHTWKFVGLASIACCALATLAALDLGKSRPNHGNVTGETPTQTASMQSVVNQRALSADDIATLRTLPCFQTDASVEELLDWVDEQQSITALENHLGAGRGNDIAQVSGMAQPAQYPARGTRVAELPDGLIEQDGRLIHREDQLLLGPQNAPSAPVRRPAATTPPATRPSTASPTPPATPPTSLRRPDPSVPVGLPDPVDYDSLSRELTEQQRQQTPAVQRPVDPSRRPFRTQQDSLLQETTPAAQSRPPVTTPPVTTPPVTTPPVTAPPANTLPPPASTPPGLNRSPLQRPLEPIGPGQPPHVVPGVEEIPPANGLPGPQQTLPPPNLPTAPNRGPQAAPGAPSPKKDPHAEIFACDLYPSAKKCQKCHEQIYREWSVSSHAYAAVSPMFNKFEQRINELAVGTVGHFCMRCHAPVGTTLGLPRHANIFDSVPAASEGVTCIVCHRVRQRYQRVNGERRIEPGDIFAPVYAAGDGSGLRDVLANQNDWKVKTSPDDKGPGQPIHGASIQFEQLSSSHFCVSCHQVAVYPGIKLEVVWEQYRASPARKQGITCQDCHMGKSPGRPDGYETASAAVVTNKPTDPHRKHSNHMFFGPGYSIAHPGTFPHHPKAQTWRYDQWLEFDWRAGWGTEAFEEALEAGAIEAAFPKTWDNVDDRYDAREIIDENLKLLGEKKHARKVLMENGSKLEGPFFGTQRRTGSAMKFHYVVTNLNSGHNMPSGSLGAQPQIWLNVVLTDPDGMHVWESGYVDSNGDIADLHSLDVAAGRIKHDHQLFNLQTKFLTTNIKGTDREMYLPINIDVDQIPFIRPSGFPITTMNHPPTIRMEAHSLPPLGHRKAHYRVPGHLIQKRGTWRLSVRMRSRAEPIYFMKFVRATPTMIQAMNERMLDYHAYSVEFEVH